MMLQTAQTVSVLQIGVTNVSQSFNATGLASEWSIGVVFLLVIALTLVIGWYLLSTLERFKKIWKIVSGLGDVVISAAIGALTIGVLYVAYILFSVGADTVSTIDPLLYAAVIAGFLGSALVGYGVRIGWAWASKRVATYRETMANPESESGDART